ncbi:hypothetical protein N431DRAFT_377908 [Stipitochalara longipes BDJ]|nr:hypothetical protein N431DRAFT_377908 [Stipitochalara longipes BDJ]
MRMYYSFSLRSLALSAILLYQVDVDASPSPNEQLQGRQNQILGTGDDYCTDGICSYASNLDANCNGFSDESDLTQWYECLCGNGYVSTQQMCIWCQVALDLPDFIDFGVSTYSSRCSSAHATIAPVPSSIIASLSAWNSSYSTFLATATLTSPGGSVKTGQATTTLSLSTGNASSSSSWTSTYTLLAPTGDNSIVTGAVAAATSSGAKHTSSSESSAEAWWAISGGVMILSTISFAISILFIL